MQFSLKIRVTIFCYFMKIAEANCYFYVFNIFCEANYFIE